MKPIAAILFLLLVTATGALRAQDLNPREGERIVVRGGIAEVAARNKAGVNLSAMTPDSLYRYMSTIDSLHGDGIRFDHAETDSLVTSLIDRTSPTGDSLSVEEETELVAGRKKQPLNSATVRRFMDDRAFIDRYIDGGVDTLLPKLIPPDTLSKRDKRRLARLDTTAYRHSAIFRDSMKLSPLIALSIPVPGLSQLYNKQAWKLPILYGSVAAGVGVWAWQTKEYKPYRRLYDYFDSRPVSEDDPGYEQYRSTMIELQTNMIRHNTNRQLALGFAAVSYMYFLVDGTLNYPGQVNHVKKATTLATVFPGAGQVYNKTYWKVPIVVGGAATLIYVIDWNNRGYQRLLKAYDDLTDDDESTIDEFTQNGNPRPASYLQNVKDSYRRSRDLAIILAGLFYVVQIIDAHATAHMKTYDVSDDLSRVTFEPVMERYYSHRMGGAVNTFGFSLNMRF